MVQEARAASALNHPNIVTIHEIETIDGIDAIVMELVSGKNLSEVIGTRLKTLKILRIAIPIADALTRAHAVGIVHRDLKPSNIMVGADGLVKVLDFGLAKLVDRDSDIRSSQGSTIGTASELSAFGAVVGTPAYMSPEQAMGATVDARSDIFSFGGVLYEMVTGSRAFPGHSVTETLDAVVNREPIQPNARRPDVPMELERLILRCLRKDPSRRMQHMADVKVELVDLQEELGGQPPPPADSVQRRGIKRAAVAALAVIVVGGIATSVALSRRRPPSDPVRLTAITTAVGNEAMPTPSPHGESVAFSWEGESSSAAERQDRDIWITLIGTSWNRPVTSGPEDDWSPSWSPDGNQIAFVRVPPGVLAGPGAVYVVSPNGGPARKIDAMTSVFSQLSWSPDSQWIAVPGHRVPNDASSKAGGILLYPLNGGAPRPLTVPRDAGYDAFPALSSDGRRLAYSSCEREIAPPCDVFIAELDTGFRPVGPARRVTQLRSPIHGVAWAPDERSIVFALSTMSIYGSGLGSQLWQVAADGQAAAHRIEAAPWGSFGPSVNRERERLIFGQDRTDIDIYRFVAPNAFTRVVASSFVDYNPSFSPDGRRIAFESSRSGIAQEIWVSDPDGANPVQVTRSTPDAEGRLPAYGNPSWSPDGRRLVFTVLAAQLDVFTIEADGSGLRQITNDAFADAVTTWSHDGRWIYYRQDRPDGRDIARVASDEGAPQRLTTKGGLYPIESWDGKTLLFTKIEGTSALYRMPSAGGEEEVLIDCVMSRALSVTPPNNLYYLAARREPALDRPQTRPHHRTGRSAWNDCERPTQHRARAIGFTGWRDHPLCTIRRIRVGSDDAREVPVVVGNEKSGHAMTVSGFTMCTAEHQPRHDPESHAQSDQSTRVKRSGAARSVHDSQLVAEGDDFQVQQGS